MEGCDGETGECASEDECPYTIKAVGREWLAQRWGGTRLVKDRKGG